MSMTEKILKNKLVFYITEETLQQEALEKLGRTLNENEIYIAKKGLEMGLLTTIDVVYSTIFNEMLDNNRKSINNA